MKHTALAALGFIVAACAHDEHAAAPSATTVEHDPSTDVAASTHTDFTPTTTTVEETSDTEGRDRANTNASTPPASVPPATVPPPANVPPSTTKNTTPPGTPPTSARPDNSGVNERDRNSTALTPMDQGENEADRTITQRIRQAVMGDSSLSFTAKNVKIITVNHKVTLRGPVKSAAERTSIEAAAKKVAGVTSVENQLEVAN